LGKSPPPEQPKRKNLFFSAAKSSAGFGIVTVARLPKPLLQQSLKIF
jgi:hypothetical protein